MKRRVGGSIGPFPDGPSYSPHQIATDGPECV